MHLDVVFLAELHCTTSNQSGQRCNFLEVCRTTWPLSNNHLPSVAIFFTSFRCTLHWRLQWVVLLKWELEFQNYWWQMLELNKCACIQCIIKAKTSQITHLFFKHLHFAHYVHGLKSFSADVHLRLDSLWNQCHTLLAGWVSCFFLATRLK